MGHWGESTRVDHDEALGVEAMANAQRTLYGLHLQVGKFRISINVSEVRGYPSRRHQNMQPRPSL